ncbi:Methyltransferase TRM13 [Cryptosporidium tyzzeri]|nr:Methyltransferase TRM13 [Cryptosporidium tyzzeri]
MEIQVQTCTFFIKSKSRNCKFPRYGDSNFCNLHKGIQDQVCDENHEKLVNKIIPCFIDGRHFVSINKIRSHIRKCSRVRDIAYELNQPFCMHNNGPPHNLLNIREKLQVTETSHIEEINRKAIKNNHSDSKKKLIVSKERLEFVDKLHDFCVREFGKNPHFESRQVDIDNLNLNRHELQAISISKEFTKRLINSENSISYNNSNKNFLFDAENSLIIEYGAGNAILSYWFIKECGKPRNKFKSSKFRSVIIDRESRRKQMEKLDESISSIRLRLDIEQFDINSLILVCNNQDIPKESIRAHMYSSLGNGNVPWIISTLLEQKIWMHDSSGKQIQTIEEVEQLSKEELKYILTTLSNGGGPDISKLEETIINNFAKKEILKIFVISKHLCGNGFDLGLKSSQNAIKEMKSGSMLIIIMSPCCHHRCLISQHLGAEMLNQIATQEGLFENTKDCFNFLASISSWSTGTSDYRSNYGFKAKYILDSCYFGLKTKGLLVWSTPHLSASLFLPKIFS